jgi:hypothetical protein
MRLAVITIPDFSATPSTLVYHTAGNSRANISLVAFTPTAPAAEPSGVIVPENWMSRLRPALNSRLTRDSCRA